MNLHALSLAPVPAWFGQFVDGWDVAFGHTDIQLRYHQAADRVEYRTHRPNERWRTLTPESRRFYLIDGRDRPYPPGRIEILP